MNILIVDDDHEKVRQIAEALESHQISAKYVQETSASAARRRLRSEEYDLLLIDLNLPETAGAKPKSEGGLSFFEILLSDPSANLPREFLFITALDSIVDEGRAKVAALGGTLCNFSKTSNSWIPVLIGKAKLAQKIAFRRKDIRCEFALVTALGDPELDAVLKLPYNWSDYRIDNDPTLYHIGKITGENTFASVVAASAQKKGMAWSAALATKIALKFHPNIMAMTGICAGIAGKTSLGDVVVADPTWDWGSGKHAENSNGSPVFRQSPVQRPLNAMLASICGEINRSDEFMRRVRANWAGPFPSGHFASHLGPMASGASVIADKSTATLIAEQNRDLIAIEMEAFAVMAACEYASTPPPASIAIKSVCDFADPDKRDDWQKYAAYTSATFADELFRRYLSQIRS